MIKLGKVDFIEKIENVDLTCEEDSFNYDIPLGLNGLSGEFSIDLDYVNMGGICFNVIGDRYDPIRNIRCRTCDYANDCVLRTINSKYKRTK